MLIIGYFSVSINAFSRISSLRTILRSKRVHSSASSAGQWKPLMDNYSEKFHFIAINLIGYGKTSTWSGDKIQSLQDQVALIDAIPISKNEKLVNSMPKNNWC